MRVVFTTLCVGRRRQPWLDIFAFRVLHLCQEFELLCQTKVNPLSRRLVVHVAGLYLYNL